MFSSFCGPTSRPNIPVRIPNDDTTFNPKEYPNVAVVAKGRMSGKVRLVHGGAETDESGLGLISTRIWVIKEGHKEDVTITPTFDDKTFTFLLEAPTGWGSNSIYHETMIQYPRTTSTIDSLSVSVPNTSLRGDGLHNLLFGSIQTALSNGSISLDVIRTDIARLRSSNGFISGTFEAGHVDFNTSNGHITAKLNIRDALDGRQSVVTTHTSNASVDVHVTATETARGLWMENISSNGQMKVGALVGKADRASWIKASTSNSKLDFNVDGSQSGQPLEIANSTSNSGIVSSVMVPAGQEFKGSASSSNSNVTVNLTEDFEGRFELSTSNGQAVVEGSELELEVDNKSTKRGYRVHDGPSKFRVTSSNGSTSLRFYPFGQSLASSENEKL